MRRNIFQNVRKIRNGLKINRIDATKPSTWSPLRYANAHAVNSYYNGTPANDVLENIDIFSSTRYTGFIKSPLRPFLTDNETVPITSDTLHANRLAVLKKNQKLFRRDFFVELESS